MAKKEVKVSLVLLKQLVASLESSLEAADAMVEAREPGKVNEYVIEMSKCMGVAAGIVQEATLVVGDIQAATRLNTMPGAAGKDEGLSSLLSILGGKGLPGSKN